MPRSRYPCKYIFSDFNSTQLSAGVYVNVIVAKSGCPVSGQTLVNSGQTISTVNSRPGEGFGNVSSCVLNGVGVESMQAFYMGTSASRRAVSPGRLPRVIRG